MSDEPASFDGEEMHPVEESLDEELPCGCVVWDFGHSVASLCCDEHGGRSHVLEVRRYR